MEIDNKYCKVHRKMLRSKQYVKIQPQLTNISDDSGQHQKEVGQTFRETKEANKMTLQQDINTQLHKRCKHDVVMATKPKCNKKDKQEWLTENDVCDLHSFSSCFDLCPATFHSKNAFKHSERSS